jgi:hypothetical protein
MPINDSDYFIGLSLLIFGILGVSVGLNYLFKNKSPEKSKLPFVFSLAGGLIGLFALILGFVLLYPGKFFGIYTGIEIAFHWAPIFSVAMLIIGIYKLFGAFLGDFSSKAKLTNLATGLLLVVVAVSIPFFQMFASVQEGLEWFHVLFGIGLLIYAVGEIMFGAFASKFNTSLRASITMMGIAIGLFSTLIIRFGFVQIYSSGSNNVQFSFGFFAELTLILIGANLLASAIFSYF